MINWLNKFFRLFLLVIVSQSAHAQNISWHLSNKEEIKKQFEITRQWYQTNPCFSVDIAHLSFEDYKILIPSEEVHGFFHKCGKNYQSKILGIQTIQNEKFRFFIDTSQNVILIGNPTNENKYPTELYTENLLNDCKTVQFNEDKLGKKFRLEFSENAYINFCEIGINKDGSYNEIILYFGNIVDKSNPKSQEQQKRPRIKIQFSNYNKNPVFDYNAEFSEANYFVFGSENKLFPTEKYKYFKINDQRINKN